MMTEQHEACIVLAQRIGELESENAQLVAELAAAHHALDAAVIATRDAIIVAQTDAAILKEMRVRIEELEAENATLAHLRKRLPVLEAAAGYERTRTHEAR